MSLSKPKVLIIIANLGTPDAPTAPAVRAFLKQFLSDQRVIEIPKILWAIILNAFVLPFRPKRVAEAYAQVWSNDSPMREILFKQVQQLQKKLSVFNTDFDLTIVPAMTYGRPGIDRVLDEAESQLYDHIILFPLFPQYSATSTAPLYDAVAKWLLKQRNIPGLSFIRDYYQHPLYIQALANSVRDYQQQHGQAEKLLMSFHGIPQPYADKGDPYADRCRVTAQKVAQALQLSDDQWAISFQSRFGKQEWVKPYTDQLLQSWAEQGVASVQILSPAFSADCLETLEELAIQNAELFLKAGGKDYAYIPALNDRDDHIDLLGLLLQTQLEALKSQLQA
ncbi:ferrochelatase [Acinetobacter bereziniae LMG 1003 = CIP 70.12]|jgi:ferrochelatase|uniref:Ferrochelatase n=1 Tax=Acinetobacter bereziniae LMG 1003 = CIP 70.12 TaxID=981324 RepID=N9EEL4_ACIBZ|nr:ferrochelatase [Acinetobacter bereziniae]ENV91270.1 ferrochelatase [Acinetobacter bereziniae LMG 1003 = CIP 70.12]MBJ8552942.1 ferrochelatase [Acinetobacter bereziniae]MBJ9909353.1 ferrochelatase [Acinetobacter bereziniae]MBJ9931002.1 ferrochelatase [Acinetobacter bereziniae]